MFLSELVSKMDPERYKDYDIDEFWCQICDLNLVDFKKPETGAFFEFTGHVLNYKVKATDSDWPTVVAAVCTHCMDPNGNLREAEEFSEMVEENK